MDVNKKLDHEVINKEQIIYVYIYYKLKKKIKFQDLEREID